MQKKLSDLNILCPTALNNLMQLVQYQFTMMNLDCFTLPWWTRVLRYLIRINIWINIGINIHLDRIIYKLCHTVFPLFKKVWNISPLGWRLARLSFYIGEN